MIDSSSHVICNIDRHEAMAANVLKLQYCSIFGRSSCFRKIDAKLWRSQDWKRFYEVFMRA